MKNFIKGLGLMVFAVGLAGGAWAEPASFTSGLGHRDDVLAIFSNPSGLAVGNGGGFYGWIEGGLPEDLNQGLKDPSYGFAFTNKNISWSWNQKGEDVTQYFAISGDLGHGIYTGVDMVTGKVPWNEDGSLAIKEWGASAMVRPIPGISAGVNVRNPYSENTLYKFGLSARPLFWLKDRDDTLTLFADAQWRGIGENLEAITGGLEVQLPLGLKLSGSHTFGTQAISVAVDMSLGFSRNTFVWNHDLQDTASLGQGLFVAGIGSTYTEVQGLGKRSVALEFPPSIAESSTLAIFPWDDQTSSLPELLAALNAVAENPDITAVVFQNQSFGAGYGQLADISAALQKIKEAGKSIVFYNQNYDTPTWLLAAAHADYLAMGPLGNLNLAVPAFQTVFLKGLLDQVGITYHNFRSHPAKAAANQYSETTMTPEERANKTRLLTSVQAWLDTLASGRGEKSKAAADTILGGGPYLRSDEVLSLGMVDALIYPDEFDEWLKTNLDPRGAFISPSIARTDSSWTVQDEDAIAYLTLVGTIGSGGEGSSPGFIDPFDVVTVLKDLANNGAYKAIVLRIDSPGGSAQGSDLIARELSRARERKPVVVSMGNVAASGGYYIAAPASWIVAAPATITGSIGVVSAIPTAQGLLEKLSLTQETLTLAPSGDFGSLLRNLTPQEKARWESSVEFYYNTFVATVAAGRKMDPTMVNEVAQGQIWSGIDAKEKGLVDELGGIETALEATKRLLGSQSIKVVPISLGGTMVPQVLDIGASLLGVDADPLISQVKTLELLGSGGAFYWWTQE